MGDHRDAAPVAGDERLEPVEPVEVEVVGRFVEQQDVEAGEEDRGERRLGHLPAGQSHRGGLEQPQRQPEVGEHLLDA